MYFSGETSKIVTPVFAHASRRVRTIGLGPRYFGKREGWILSIELGYKNELIEGIYNIGGNHFPKRSDYAEIVFWVILRIPMIKKITNL